MTEKISVLLPTRSRDTMMRHSVESLLNNATRPDDVEICIAVDPDDHIPYPPGTPSIRVHVSPERYGYGGLHRYYNDLAEFATGDWLFIWNDDAVMRTHGWDAYIRGLPFSVLWSYVPEALGMNCFPVIPAAWFECLGRLSLDHSIDMWIIALGEQLRRTRHIPVTVSHRKVRDATALARDQLANVATFHAVEMERERAKDLAKLAALLEGVPANPRLVSVVTGAEPTLAADLSRLVLLADEPGEVEFVVIGGNKDREYRQALEIAGLMGMSQVHPSSDSMQVKSFANGAHVVMRGTFPEVEDWDQVIRDA